MTNIEKILEYIDKERVSISEFERKSGISNAYLTNTKERGADISQKILDRIKSNNPEDYSKIFSALPENGQFSTISDSEPNYMQKRREAKNASVPLMVPLVPIKAQAGYARSFASTDYLNKLDLYPIFMMDINI